MTDLQGYYTIKKCSKIQALRSVCTSIKKDIFVWYEK